MLRGQVTVADPVFPAWVRTFDVMADREAGLRKLVDGAPVTVPVLGNNYTVRFNGSGKCLDSAGDNANIGAFSQLYECHGFSNQRLRLERLSGSGSSAYYRMRYKRSNLCLDVENNGSPNAGARVIQNTCSSSRASQQFTLGTLSQKPYPFPRTLRFRHSNLCMVVRNQETENSTPIEQNTCPANYNAAFHLVE